MRIDTPLHWFSIFNKVLQLKEGDDVQPFLLECSFDGGGSVAAVVAIRTVIFNYSLAMVVTLETK